MTDYTDQWRDNLSANAAIGWNAVTEGEPGVIEAMRGVVLSEYDLCAHLPKSGFEKAKRRVATDFAEAVEDVAALTWETAIAGVEAQLQNCTEAGRAGLIQLRDLMVIQATWRGR
ncbi:hypothetical protein M2341_002049 [Sphingobium sp. B7D2B]|uniref:hypothetical protein n=1 Tax=Sphingobium sp. B7D2B TaxID=2940583 RepID=UPI00222539E2|nr:hypothetical protein [Sphingobium sp. B7D2B]MCW2366602.1 hypothetical protein [Sphingobium sp. B7D2B]